MSLYICSLAANQPQSIKPRTWTTVRFPYTQPPESYDVWDMHRASQPGGAFSIYPDRRSALIWPQINGWGTVEGHLELEPGDYTEVRSMFVRDPYGYNGDPDPTADEHHAVTPGMQFYNRLHMLFVHPGVSLAFEMYHNGSDYVDLVYSQFKLSIETDVAVPE